MVLRIATTLLAIAALGSADTLTLRSGRIVRGQYVGGDARHIKMTVGDHVENYAVDDVNSLQFGGGGNDRPDYPPPSDNQTQGRDYPPPPPPPAPGPASYGPQVPVGSTITVRMIDKVDSEVSRLGETFRASVDEPVMVNDQTVIPRGADAVVKLVEDKQSGKFEGRTVLTLALIQVSVNGHMVDITTGDVSQASGSRGARTAKVVGGTAALGAVIGAIAGGGKGAAIGAGSGAAVGGAAQVLTNGQRVKIPSETRLNFTLQQPVNL